jgi:hypothetical protein
MLLHVQHRQSKIDCFSIRTFVTVRLHFEYSLFDCCLSDRFILSSFSLSFQMLHRLVRCHSFSTRYLSSSVWREKLAHGPSLKSFIEQTNDSRTVESTCPPYVTSTLSTDDLDEPFDPLKHKKRRVYFDVYGCQMNENDTDIAYTFLDKHGGYERVQHEHDADIVL